MAANPSHPPKPEQPGKFERFWNQLFTYAYDCDTPQSLIVNETFFIVLGIVFAWFCGLSLRTGSKLLVWIALAVMVIVELYLIVSVFIGLTTFFLSLIRRKRIERYGSPDRPTPRTTDEPQKKEKKQRRKYKVNNRRF